MMIEKSDINLQLLAEMRSTRGWKLFEAMMRSKYDADVRSLVTSSDVNDVILKKVRCKLITELLAESGVIKEERWTI